jgi:hypothetical protein
MAGDSQVTIQIQQLQLLVIALAASLVLFGIWLVRSYWPRQMEKRAAAEEKARNLALEKAQNELKIQQDNFNEDLAHRRQLREMEFEQHRHEAAMNNQILQGFLEGQRTNTNLSERYLDHSERMLSELAGHRAVLTDVSDTIGKLHADYEGLKIKMAEIVQGVQSTTTASNASTAALNQMKQIVLDFGAKLDTYAQAVKGDTGRIAAINPPVEAVPQ